MYVLLKQSIEDQLRQKERAAQNSAAKLAKQQAVQQESKLKKAPSVAPLLKLSPREPNFPFKNLNSKQVVYMETLLTNTRYCFQKDKRGRVCLFDSKTRTDKYDLNWTQLLDKDFKELNNFLKYLSSTSKIDVAENVAQLRASFLEDAALESVSFHDQLYVFAEKLSTDISMESIYGFMSHYELKKTRCMDILKTLCETLESILSAMIQADVKWRYTAEPETLFDFLYLLNFYFKSNSLLISEDFKTGLDKMFEGR